MKRVVLDSLRDGPKTCPEIADMLGRPDLARKCQLQRAYMALLRLETKGVVCRNGGTWCIESSVDRPSVSCYF